MRKNQAYTFKTALLGIGGGFQVNPTIEAGDFKISTGGANYANLTTTPVVEPAGSISVKVSLTDDEINADEIVIHAKDVEGDEWVETVITIETDEPTCTDLRGTVNQVTDNGIFSLNSDLLSDTVSAYTRMWFVFTSGMNRCIPRVIAVYTGGDNKIVRFTGDNNTLRGPFPNTIAPGDEFMILAGVP